MSTLVYFEVVTTTDPTTAQPSSPEEPEGQDEAQGLGDYPIDSVLIRSETRTVFEIVRRIGQGVYIMDPDFQRDFVWPEDKQSRLIESVLMRIPLPVFYLAENPDGKLVVVDGLQRLTTFERFMSNQLKLQLKNPELSERRFDDLLPKLKNRIEDTQLTLYLIDAKAPERARLDIFERVNSGMSLTRQQMRNSLYQGPATRLLRDLAKETAFIMATGGSLNKTTMRDREAINRFCAFYVLGPQSYPDEMDEFLAESLRHINRQPSDKVDEYRAAFLRSMKNNIAVFGEHSFRKRTRGQTRRSVVNMSLFDVASTGMARYGENIVTAKKKDLQEGVYRLMEDDEFTHSITYGTSGRGQVLTRFRRFDSMLAEVLGAP